MTVKTPIAPKWSRISQLASQINPSLGPYACRNRCVLKFRLKEVTELAALSSRGRKFPSLGAATPKCLSPCSYIYNLQSIYNLPYLSIIRPKTCWQPIVWFLTWRWASRRFLDGPCALTHPCRLCLHPRRLSAGGHRL